MGNSQFGDCGIFPRKYNANMSLVNEENLA